MLPLTPMLRLTRPPPCLALQYLQLDGLQAEERPNPRAKKGPPMRLYPKEELERAALARWGSLAALEAERERRRDRREQRSIAAFFKPPQPPVAVGEDEDAAAAVAGEDGAPAKSQQQQAQAHAQKQEQSQPGATPWPVARQLPWLQRLPPFIAERVCPVPHQAGAAPAAAPEAAAAAAVQQGGQEQQQGEPRYVLYLMQTALRGHENPALDAAAAAAAHLGLPLLVASFLLACHPYACERRWKFTLEGLRDAQAELRRQARLLCGGCLAAGGWPVAFPFFRQPPAVLALRQLGAPHQGCCACAAFLFVQGVDLLVYLEGWSDRQGQQAEQEAAAQAVPAPATSPQAGAAADPYLPGFAFLPAAGLQQSGGWWGPRLPQVSGAVQVHVGVIGRTSA